MQKKINVCLLYGGQSSEHDISKKSAAFAFKNINPANFNVFPVGIARDGRWIPQQLDYNSLLQAEELPLNESDPAFKQSQDIGPKSCFQQIFGSLNPDQIYVVFPILHGSGGEDGTIQGLCDLAGIACVGSGLLGSAIGMNKVVTKELAAHHGILVAPYVTFTDKEWKKNPQAYLNQITANLKAPFFVKPCSLGSSVGISKVKKSEDLKAAIEHALDFDLRVLVEEGLTARELECAILGDETNQIVTLTAEVVTQSAEFYSYEAKYLDPNGAKVIAPASVDDLVLKRIQEATVTIFRALHLHGLARIDFFYNQTLDLLYLNEVNTLPGLTSLSQYPILMKLAGIHGEELCHKLIDLAWEKKAREQKLNRYR